MNSGHFDPLGKKNLIFNLFIIIIALVIASYIFKYQRKQISDLKVQETSERKRQQALLELSRVEKKYLNLKAKINENEIKTTISSLGNMAKESSVKIAQIRPQPAGALPFYTTYPFDLSVTAKNYHSLAVFFSKLEDSPPIYIIDSLRISPSNVSDQESQGVSGELRLFTITVPN